MKIITPWTCILIQMNKLNGRFWSAESLVVASYRQSMNQCYMGSTRQNASGRPSLDDVERLSFGKAAKKRGTGSRDVCHRLNESERSEFDNAKKRGFLVLRGTGYRKERKGSPLGNIFRQFCDAKAMPYVSVEQAVGINVVDTVHVDLSTLRERSLDSIKDDICQISLSNEGSLVSASSINDPLQFVDDIQLEEDPIWKIPFVELVFAVKSRKEAKVLGEKFCKYWTERGTTGKFESSSAQE